MKKYVLTLLVMSSLLFSSTAFSAGSGVFLDFSSGSGDYELDSGYEYDIDADVIAGGFVFDTAPTNESVFNYRLNVGIAGQSIEDEYDVDMDATGIYVENIFGFALIKNENFRWWLGPLLRIGYYSGDSKGKYEDYIGPYTVKMDFDYAEFGVGIVTGLNFKAGNVVIAPSIGVRYSGYVGEAEVTESDNWGVFDEYDEDIEATTHMVFANIALLF